MTPRSALLLLQSTVVCGSILSFAFALAQSAAQNQNQIQPLEGPTFQNPPIQNPSIQSLPIPIQTVPVSPVQTPVSTVQPAIAQPVTLLPTILPPARSFEGKSAEGTTEGKPGGRAELAPSPARDPARVSPAGPISGASQAEPVCVVMSKARLRVAPTPTAKISWVVGQHMPLERLRSKGVWSQVRDMRGQIHWVISKALTPNEACAVVRVRTAALHQGPGFGAPRADFKSADRYSTFRRIEREGQWVRLEDNRRGSYWTLETNLWMPIKKSRMSF